MKNLKVIFVCFAVLLTVFCIFGPSINATPVHAADAAPMYTVRLYSLRFSDADAAGITGGIGTQYSVKVKQDWSTESYTGVRMYFNVIEGERYLSMSAGQKKGDVYAEFKVREYWSLNNWLVVFQNQTYAITPINAVLEVSADGSFYVEEGRTLYTPASSVYDANNRKLFYLPDGTVVNEDNAITFDGLDGGVSLGVNYKDGKFINDLGVELNVSEPTSAAAVSSSGDYCITPVSMLEGVKHRYLLKSNGNGYIRSVEITDNVYKVEVREDGQTDKYFILTLSTPKEEFQVGFWEVLLHPIRSIKQNIAYAKDPKSGYEWYNLRGHEINVSAYAEFNIPFDAHVCSRLNIMNMLNASGTVGDYYYEIVADGQPYTEIIAIDVSTGAQLYDDRMNPISVEGRQLVDVAGWPLISSTLYPCFIDENGIYYTVDGKLTRYNMTVNSNKQLVDANGVIIHSVIGELEDKQELYFFWLSDRNTFMPGKVIKDNLTGEYIFTDIGGNDIPSSVLGTNNISMADRYQKHPSEKPVSAWDSFVAWVPLIIFCLIIIVAVILISLVVGVVKK